MKTYKISCRKIKISISPRGGTFQFSAGGESYVYLKKPGWISPRLRVACLRKHTCIRCSHPEVFQGKHVLKICSKFTGEHPYRSAISIKLLQHGRSPVNFLHVFRTAFLKNTSAPLFLVYIRLNLTCFVHTSNKRFFQLNFTVAYMN